METISDSELNEKEFDSGYAEALDRSVAEAEKCENLVCFTMESYMAYSPSQSTAENHI